MLKKEEEEVVNSIEGERLLTNNPIEKVDSPRSSNI
jgi:hypothetical protein